MNLRVIGIVAMLAAVSTPTMGAETGKTLAEQIRAADSALFAAVFETCDVQTVASMVAEDFEFFHDKWGQIAKTKDEFVKNIDGGCQRQRQGTDFKASRRLIPGTFVVYPMKGYGAIEMGEHQFFKVGADGSVTPTEYAKFTQLWHQVNGRWLLARVLSYAHTDGSRPEGNR